MGVEEEFLLVDPNSGRPRAAAEAVLRPGRHGHADLPHGGTEGLPHGGTDGLPQSQADRLPQSESDGLLQSELQSEQLETGTRPCSSMTELADQIRVLRHSAAAAARAQGVALAALGTSPLPVRPTITPEERYVRMAGEYALTAAEHLICGCHVHVAVESPEEGVAVLDRIRPWLPVLLALSANSPFWQGRDSGYASYRRQVMGRWPSSGPTELFGTPASYRTTVQEMLDTGAILDEGMVYFDARLSRRYPTVEIRVADVCLLMDDTLLVAALVGALVETAARAWRAGRPAPPVRAAQLRLATWRASRSGLRHDLVHPLTGRPAPAETVVRALVEHTTPVLAENGDLITVEGLLLGVLKRGNGAEQQWDVRQRGGDLSEVVSYAVARTLEA